MVRCPHEQRLACLDVCWLHPDHFVVLQAMQPLGQLDVVPSIRLLQGNLPAQGSEGRAQPAVTDCWKMQPYLILVPVHKT